MTAVVIAVLVAALLAWLGHRARRASVAALTAYVDPAPTIYTGPVVPMRMQRCDAEIAILDYWRARRFAVAMMRSRRVTPRRSVFP